MAQPQSLLAELRALESRRSTDGLSAAEERRLAELRAVVGGGAVPGQRGFDVSAAAAALHGGPPSSSQAAGAALDVGALGPRTPPLAPELSEPEGVAPAAELAPLPGLDAGSPAGYELEAPPPEPPVEAQSPDGYDVVPSFEATGRAEVVGEVPADWSAWQEPGAGVEADARTDGQAQAQPELEAQAEAQPEAAAEGQWDPALAAQWEAYALAQGWDPNAPWDPEAVARQWDSFLRSLGWDPASPQAWDPNAQPAAEPATGEVPEAAPAWDASAAPAEEPGVALAEASPAAGAWDPGAVPSEDAGVAAAWAPPAAADAPLAGDPHPDASAHLDDPATTARWRAEHLGLHGTVDLSPAPVPRRESDTASWDLSGPVVEPEHPMELTTVPDERDPGATAMWSLSDVAGARSAIPASWSDDPEPVHLDELHLESGGSFGAADPGLVPLAIPELIPAPPAPPAAPPRPPITWPPPAEAPTPTPAALDVEPIEVGDDQILEVGDDVLEVAEAPPASQPSDDGEDLPVVEAVDVAEESPMALGTPAPGALAFAPPEPLEPEPPARALVSPPGPEPTPRPVPGTAPQPTPPPAGEPVPLESLAIEETPLEPAGEIQSRVLPGLHRVVLHTVEGQVMRGLLQDPDLLSTSLPFSAQLAAAPEQLPADRVRAIFFMLSPGEQAPEPSGVKVRVTFRDGRQVAGFSPDYDPGASGFFMIPADTRTNTARIWVYRASVRQVSVS